jgi:ribonuclease P protein component
VAKTFPKAQRLHQPAEFHLLLQSRAVVNKWLALYLKPNVVGYKRLGIIASKRVMARAVDRNRAKRAIREVFRQCDTNIGALDVVVRVRSNPRDGDIDNLRQSLSHLLTKVRMIKNDSPATFSDKDLSISN